MTIPTTTLNLPLDLYNQLQSLAQAEKTDLLDLLTSDHTVANLPYGTSKGAMDRIVLAAAHELKDLILHPLRYKTFLLKN